MEDLANMGSASVSLSQFEEQLCIHKQNVSEVELGFYLYAARQLLTVNTPKLLAVRDSSLFLERIPNRITLDSLVADQRSFQQLAAIHTSDYQPSFTVKEHSWKPESTEQALSVLDLPKSTQQSIRDIQAMSSQLFHQTTLISGDTNDGNWGTRANGDLVLYDWERFGYGSPAIDLAPLVTGLGSLGDYTSIVERYLRYNSTISIEALSKQLILAKCWLVVEVTNILVVRKKLNASLYINWYRENVPKWLDSVEIAL